MKRPNTLRRKRQRKQRSRRHSRGRHTRRNRHKQRGGNLPAPPGSLVAISTGGEDGVPILMSKEQAEVELEKGGLEE